MDILIADQVSALCRISDVFWCLQYEFTMEKYDQDT